MEKVLSNIVTYSGYHWGSQRDLFISIRGYRGRLVVGEDIDFVKILRYKPEIYVMLPWMRFEVRIGVLRRLYVDTRRFCYIGRLPKKNVGLCVYY